MGLDMYLEKHIYIGAMFDFKKVTGKIEIKIGDREIPVNFNKVSCIVEQAAYWRKENAIHNWFVVNVQKGEDDCGRYYVSKENIETLLTLVNKVLKNHALAAKLLPTQSGFFFGSTDFDEYYFEGLEYTKTVLEEAIKCESDEFYYHSSW